MAAALLLLATFGSVLALERPDGIGRLPALGWNSWNAYGCSIDEQKFLAAANLTVSLGLKDSGYTYVNIDDCWSVKAGRDNTTQQIIPDVTKFPQGIIGLASKVHALGLKIGIYSSAGTETCAGYPASIGYESIDAATFAGWGIDYLKYDNCYVPSNWTDTCSYCVGDYPNTNNGSCAGSSTICAAGYDYSTSNTARRYTIMRDALSRAESIHLVQSVRVGIGGRIYLGQPNCQQLANHRRHNVFDRILAILNTNSFLMDYSGFTGHGDPDMLEVGNGVLTVQETRTHFALWAMMKAPLIIGTDLSKLSQVNLDILRNKYLLAFNQDPVYGASAAPYKWGTNPDWTENATNPAEFWSGESQQGTLVAMMNTRNDTASRNMTADFSEIPGLQAGGSYNVTNAWLDQSMGCQTGSVNLQVDAHDTAVLLIQQG